MTAQSFAICLLLFTTSAFGQVTFILQDIPRSTPAEDTIYLTGPFSDWKSLPEYRLKRRLDGSLAITLPKGAGSFEYKFNRGDWQRAETDVNNRFLPNRKFTYGNGETVLITIYNWQDAGGARPFDFLTFYFFAASLFILPAGYYLRELKNKKKPLTAIIVVFMTMLCAGLLGRILFEIAPLSWQFMFEQTGIILFTAMAPMWHLMISATLDLKRSRVILWIPVSVLACYAGVKYLVSSTLPSLTDPIAGLVTVDQAITMTLVTASLMTSFISAVIMLQRIKASPDLNPMQRTLAMKFFWTGAMLMSCVLLVELISLANSDPVISWIQNFPFLAGSIMLFIVGYLVVKYSDVLKQPPGNIKRDDLSELKLRVHNGMTTQKFYLNAALTLPELAEALDMKPHTLSKVINDGFEQNFRDFVNKYRVDEFIRLAKDEANKRYTFLALAYEVGFNSKSTFNAAFKKATHQSPRDYFQSTKRNTLMTS